MTVGLQVVIPANGAQAPIAASDEQAGQTPVQPSSIPADGAQAPVQPLVSDRHPTHYMWFAIVAAFLSRVTVFYASYYRVTRQGILSSVAAAPLRDPKYTEALHGLAGKLFDPWAHWDGVWFVRIASEGYTYPHSEAFFPLYPFLMRAVSHVTGGNYVLAGIAISLVAYALSMVVLYKLVRPLFGASVAAWSVAFISWFPTSVVFSAVYSESLFLLLTVASLWFATRRLWWAAGLAGLFAALTRNSGVLLVFPLVLLYGRECGWSWRRPELRWPRELSLAWIVLTPVGLLIYMTYLKLKFGSWMMFSTAETFWRRHLSDPVSTLVRGYRDAARAFDQLADAEKSLIHWLQPGHPGQDIVVFYVAPFAALAFAVVVLALAARRLPVAYTTWAILGLLLALCYPTVRWPMYSLHRFVLVLFPVFIAEALVTRFVFPLRWVLLALSAAGLVWYTFVFAAFAHIG